MHRCITLIICLTACTSRDARLATAAIDTLPGGIVRVTSSGPTGWADTRGWTLRELPPIQPAAGSPGELIDPVSLAVDDDGRIYVGDQQPVNIKLFDSAGRFLRLIGREGDGPGEFRSAYVAVRGHWLLVHDPEADRTNLFDTSGVLVRTFRVEGNYSDEVAIDGGWRIVLPLSYNRRSSEDRTEDLRTGFFLRFDTLGALLDTISVPTFAEPRHWTVRGQGRIGVAAVPIPFMPQMVWGVGRDSGLFYGVSNAYTILRAADHRDTTFIIERNWTPETLSDSVRRASVEPVIQMLMKADMDEVTLRNTFKLEEIPTTAPSFLRLVQDDGDHLWAQRPGHGHDTPFDVFSAEGAFLGVVDVPADLPPYTPLRIRHHRLFAALVDESGFPVVRRWAIQDGQDGQDGRDGRDGQVKR